MTIVKAILILDLLLHSEARRGTVDQHDAIKLGIEALKRYQDYKVRHIGWWELSLPSEPED
ncbi:unnamed protein product [marine sediment metagenome]|uniref:Uncharacterized protein n=1 Tax=marine sediment metagenome TaxID=412755 RepID=X1T0E9_9ZZZZ